MRLDPLRGLLSAAAFRALLRIRLLGQTADGLLQAGLVGVVLFSPERQPSPGRVALGFAVILLPFCLAAPLAGVLLDRWSRVAVLAWTNVIRAGLLVLLALLTTTATASDAALFGTALLVLACNRLILAALGAALPQTLPESLLVSGNALAPTLGTGVAVVGGGVGLALTAWTPAAPFVVAAVGYVLAAAATRRFTRGALGPQLPDEAGSPFRRAWDDVRTGAVHIARTPTARRGLEAMAAHRLLFGALTVWSIVLVRFGLEVTRDDQPAALAGLGSLALALGGGLVIAAVLTPPLVQHIGGRRTGALSMALAAAGSAVALVGPRLSSLVAGWLLLGAGAQMLKITVDTLLQRSVSDEYRGRVFIAYDIVFNVAFVVGGAVVALVPLHPVIDRGVPAVVVAAYAALALALYRSSPRRPS